jgi:hypothetical protein
VVDDIDRARAELVERNGSPGPMFHFVEGSQVEGPDPDRADYGTFFELHDPDGNGWLVQEVGHQS